MKEKYLKLNSTRYCYYDGVEYYYIQIEDEAFAIVQKDLKPNASYKEITKEEFTKEITTSIISETIYNLFV